jgi:hypothetical protein
MTRAVLIIGEREYARDSGIEAWCRVLARVVSRVRGERSWLLISLLSSSQCR